MMNLLNDTGGFCDISFTEKTKIFSDDYLKCCMYIANIKSSKYLFTKMLYSKLISSSQILEDFLDFHGARNSKKWFFYRELSATVNHLSMTGYSQKHILNRTVFYNLPESKEFQIQGETTLEFLNRTLIKLAPVIIEEARKLDIPIPQKGYGAEAFPGITTIEILPADFDDEEDKGKQKKHIVNLASQFLDVAGYFSQYEFYKPNYDMKKILELVPEKINEVEIRRYEMLVHNLQSFFDSYIILGGLSTGDKKLKSFRSFFSVVFHILQLTGRLLHFYERHLHRARCIETYEKVRIWLSKNVEQPILLDRIINYGLYYICYYLSLGSELAREILNENIDRCAITLDIPKDRGFHCRPSLLVAKIVHHYGGKVEMCIGSDRFDASSVLDIQWAGGKIKNENISKVIFEGDSRALKDIALLASLNYCEDVMGKGLPIPKELSYLRE